MCSRAALPFETLPLSSMRQSRNSFERYLVGNVTWYMHDSATLFDIHGMASYWKQHGLVVHPTPRLMPDKANTYIAKLPMAGIPPYEHGQCVTKTLELGSWDRPGHPHSIAPFIRKKAIEAARGWQNATGRAPVCLNMDVSSTFFQVQAARCVTLLVHIVVTPVICSIPAITAANDTHSARPLTE